MPVLTSLLLFVGHLFYSLSLAVWAFHGRWIKHAPLPLDARRSKMPKHFGIVLVCEEKRATDIDVQEAFVHSVERAAAWCKVVGIPQLTVYDRHGVLVSVSEEIKQRLNVFERGMKAERALSTTVYPPTPPLTDDCESQHSEDGVSRDALGLTTVYPELELEALKCDDKIEGGMYTRGASPDQNSALSVQLASLPAGKQTMVSVANSLLFAARQELRPKNRTSPFSISVNDLQGILEGDGGLGPPDMMIVHHVTCPARQKQPLEMYGFPPWQIRLTEIYYDGSWPLRIRLLRLLTDFYAPVSLLTEVEFRRALDLFSKAEFRVGK